MNKLFRRTRDWIQHRLLRFVWMVILQWFFYKGNTITTVDLLDAIFEIENEQVIRENRRSDTAPACRICMEGDITMVLLPCRHLLCCERCAEQLKKCPWCRSTILGTLKTFLMFNSW